MIQVYGKHLALTTEQEEEVMTVKGNAVWAIIKQEQEKTKADS